MDEPELVAIVELSGNANEDAWAQADWHAKIAACEAAGITDRCVIAATPIELGLNGVVVTAADGRRFAARIARRETGGPPTNLPGRTLRPGDPDWPL